MKYRAKLSSMIMLSLSLLVVSGISFAQDSVLRSESPHFIEDGWDFRAAIGLRGTKGEFYRGMKDLDGLILNLEASYTSGNFYAIANEDDGLLLGYSLLRDENWVVDAVFGPKFGVNFDDRDEFDGQLRDLDNRNEDGHLGGRFTWYGDSNRVSISVTRDVVGVHGGYLASIDYQQEWQLRNWLFTGRSGFSACTDKMTNHIAGVSDSEATATFPQYKAGAGQAVLLELTAEYPVNENWVFETKATITQYSKAFKDSPIINDDTLSVITTGFKYQF